MQVPSPASPAHAGNAGTCPAAIPGERTPADALAYQLIRVSKLLRTIRSEAPRAHPAVDGTAYPLLFNLAGGPLRISTLAERTHVEVSTVSRAATALERHGILERIPDPADGRAHLLSLTDDGLDALGALQEQRQEWFSELLSDWRAEDVAQLRELLTRFGDCVEAYRNKAL